jgi:hypothetical protein
MWNFALFLCLIVYAKATDTMASNLTRDWTQLQTENLK